MLEIKALRERVKFVFLNGQQNNKDFTKFLKFHVSMLLQQQSYIFKTRDISVRSKKGVRRLYFYLKKLNGWFCRLLQGRGSYWGLVFAGGREMKTFSTVFRDFGKNMVGKRYFEHQTVPVNTGKNNEKSGFEIIKNGILKFGHLLKKKILFLTLVRFLEHFGDF